MPQRSADQITLVDLTDGVSVILSSESYTFPGTVTAAIAGNTTTKVQALMGGVYVAASVNVANVTKPTGVTVTSDNHATSPTLTIAVAGTVTTGGEVIIPVVVDGITIEKRFSYSIAFEGKGGTSSTLVGLKNEAQTIVTNADGVTLGASTITVDFYGYVGATRTATTAVVSGLPTGITTSTNTAGTSGADGVLRFAVAAGSTLGGTDTGLITVTLTCGGIARPVFFSWSKAKAGATGIDGTNAVSLEVTSSAGNVFKNTAVNTTLTAKVYVGGTEVAVGALGVVAGLGTVKWYKDGVYLTGKDLGTLAVAPADVPDRAVYEAKLEY